MKSEHAGPIHPTLEHCCTEGTSLQQVNFVEIFKARILTGIHLRASRRSYSYLCWLSGGQDLLDVLID